MKRALLGGLVSAATTFVAAPLVRGLLVRRGSMDIPNQRSSHSVPVPRGGGLACLIGVASGFTATGQQASVPARALIGIGALSATGLADDLLGHVHHNARLAMQASSGALLAPNLPSAPLSALGTAGVVNVVNFMDGINGITGSTAVVWGVSTLLVGRGALDASLQTIGAVTAGAGLGFLPWNTPQAQLFLGDVGSYLFGGLCAAGISQAASRDLCLAWHVAAPLLPYAADAAQALALRALRGELLTEAHREHVYQRLVDEQGLTHVQVAALHAATASVIAAAARKSITSGAVLTSASLGMYLGSPVWLRAVRRQGTR